jgi:outer membrane protein
MRSLIGSWALALALTDGSAAPARAQAPSAAPPLSASQPQSPPMQVVEFDEAVHRAIAANPDVAQAAQTILRAEAVLLGARAVHWPTVNGTVTTTLLEAERGFNGLVTQPQTQSAFSGAVSYPVLSAARWAQAVQASDRVRVAQIGAEETRRQVAIAAAEGYLAIVTRRRQVEVNARALEHAQVQLDYATTRLDAGAGSRLNQVRAAQEVETVRVLLEATNLLVRRAQEALGVILAVDAPVDAGAEPSFEVPVLTGDTWLQARTDVRLSTAQVEAAERVVSDSWKDWVPVGTASFLPQLITPAGLFQPSRTWSAVLQFAVPIFDGGVRRAARHERETLAESARIDLTDVQIRARSEERAAAATVESTGRALESARLAAKHAAEVLRITDIAFRAGATTNLEVIDAQRRARDTDTAATIAEDLMRQARLDLLVALGRFPN